MTIYTFRHPDGWTGRSLVSMELARLQAFMKWWDYGRVRGYKWGDL